MLYSRNEHNTVNQLNFNKFLEKNTTHPFSLHAQKGSKYFFAIFSSNDDNLLQNWIIDRISQQQRMCRNKTKNDNSGSKIGGD